MQDVARQQPGPYLLAASLNRKTRNRPCRSLVKLALRLASEPHAGSYRKETDLPVTLPQDPAGSSLALAAARRPAVLPLPGSGLTRLFPAPRSLLARCPPVRSPGPLGLLCHCLGRTRRDALGPTEVVSACSLSKRGAVCSGCGHWLVLGRGRGLSCSCRPGREALPSGKVLPRLRLVSCSVKSI